ncbi:MAG: bifunctional hydroxymethylpyrimidine kinase/phosphomethylpyrimidine kinase [Anaerovorax sp.]|nr:bifunctional hydroxymethylpyrimidine kinase/phosphomethylpyrimidine kinase [Anaerovorax sp.]
MNTALTIAGSDCSGGAGIQADIKTMTAHGIYAMSAITALTAQNTTGVQGIFECSPSFLEQQLDCIFTDIFPDAVKIGMVSSTALISVIANKLSQYHAKNIVLDPVMVSTSGSKLLSDGAVDSMTNLLAPLATILTPNISEAEVLSGISIKSPSAMEKAAQIISKKSDAAVLVKGGHSANNADDLLYFKGQMKWFKGEKINNSNTHGTGCTLSSAIACGLAKGLSLEESVKKAKEYISEAIKANLNLGRGNGPLNHCYKIGE